jgi:hypothetical protein
MSSRADDTVGLRWMFLLVIGAGLLGAQVIVSGLEVKRDAADGVARLLDPVQPQRIRSGYQPVPSEQLGLTGPAVIDVAPAAVAVIPVADSTAVPTAAPLPTASTDSRSDGAVRVVNTDGLGVVLHSAPRKDARQPRGFLEGTRLTVLERSGDQWARVRGENGQEGWVAAQYLSPAD